VQGSGGLILSMPTQIEHRTASQTGRTPRPRAVARDASAADGFGQNGPRWRDFRATLVPTSIEPSVVGLSADEARITKRSQITSMPLQLTRSIL